MVINKREEKKTKTHIQYIYMHVFVCREYKKMIIHKESESLKEKQQCGTFIIHRERDDAV